MADLAELQTRLGTLEAVRDQGALTVEYNGKRVTYRSDAELVAAINNLKARIAAFNGAKRVREIRVYSVKD